MSDDAYSQRPYCTVRGRMCALSSFLPNITVRHREWPFNQCVFFMTVSFYYFPQNSRRYVSAGPNPYSTIAHCRINLGKLSTYENTHTLRYHDHSYPETTTNAGNRTIASSENSHESLTIILRRQPQRTYVRNENFMKIYQNPDC